MSTGTQLALWLLALLVGGGGIAGVVMTLLKHQNKLGPKPTELGILPKEAKDAAVTGAIVAERVDRSDVVGRMRNSQF